MIVKKHVLSGITPSGNLHIGNYLGAVVQWKKLLTPAYETFFMVADLHAITVAQDPVKLRQKTLEIVKIYLSAGLDPHKCTLFIQSHIPAHTQLAWVFTCLTTMGEMERMTQYKDKSQKGGREQASVGLFTYPILMAADILLYDTAFVPVGEDQVQHIEMARDVAKRFNYRYGEVFRIPEAMVMPEGRRIMGLDNPLKKMSKSSESMFNYIALLDEPDVVRKKIMKAVTDSGNDIVYTSEKPAIKNLLDIYSLLSGISPAELCDRYAGKGYGEFKRELAEVVVDFLIPLQERYHTISDSAVEDVLRIGSERASAVAQKMLSLVYEKVGLVSW